MALSRSGAPALGSCLTNSRVEYRGDAGNGISDFRRRVPDEKG